MSKNMQNNVSSCADSFLEVNAGIVMAIIRFVVVICGRTFYSD